MNDPFRTFDQLRQAYLRYLDSPFRVRYPALLEERRDLLDQDRQLYRNPLFEPVAPYESSRLTVRQACSRLGISNEIADFLAVAGGLFPANRQLFEHQFQSWEASRRSEAVVVTTGTGSGKTECYLIPVFAYLLEESAVGWGQVHERPANRFWWSHRGQGRINQRVHEPHERARAVRALFLYPLNALIEDQLGRIRRACDGPAGRAWLDAHRGRHRFWFGRYTGATPVSGPQNNQNKRQELRRRLREMHGEWTRAVASAQRTGNDEILTYFQDPDGSEMWSRWDMQDAPPDILITNYSMLNIMLMRSLENNVFDATERWLAADREKHIFHLVVDELHTYRGTPGTEVGYLLRALLQRLGVEPDSPQLRIIATSASIEANDPRSFEYLEQFFGRDQSSFNIIDGRKSTFPTGRGSLQARPFVDFGRILAAEDLQSAVTQLAVDTLASPTGPSPERQLGEVLRTTGALEQIRLATLDQPFTLDGLARELFGNDSDGPAAARALVRAVVLAREERGGSETAPLPLRVHYFFHNAGRLWICVNPDCPGRTGVTPPGAPAPPVGRFYVEPRPRCDCDSCDARVLELLYCQPCGEVFLGGYGDEDPNATNAWFLSPDYPHLERVPDRSASLDRTHGEYLIFWPSAGPLARQTSPGPSWRWTEKGNAGYQWRPARLDHVEGRLYLPPRRARGAVPGETAGFIFLAPVEEANAFPSKCPHCASDWARRLGVQSPIRDLGSGFQRIVQLLCDALVREMPEQQGRKLVLFSDSRQDAAKLSTGTKLSHYLDTLRQIAFGSLRRAGEEALREHQRLQHASVLANELLQLLRKQAADRLDPEEEARRDELCDELPVTVVGELTSHLLLGSPPPAALSAPPPPPPFMAIQFRALLNEVRTTLLSLGMNPGGPLPSVVCNRGIWWTELFDWTSSPIPYKASLPPVEQNLQNDIERSLREHVISDVLFASASRDFESLGLGYLWVRSSGPANTLEQASACIVRMLAHRWRFVRPDAQGQPQAPGYVDDFLGAIAPGLGQTTDALRGDVEATLGGALNQWLVQPDSMFVICPRPREDGTIDVFDCLRCSRTHLHPSGGTCTSCLVPLPAAPTMRAATSTPEDFYEYLARCDEPPFRLNSEELTGQTNRVDRRLRQRRFQEIFMDDENALSAGVDLLSVTTTMEAGVDIGALQAIALGNMPPIRFNYQQRVGRAGRRGLGMSAALTLCRGRSHDDYYFERPRLITAEPPPRPYVDVSRVEIARRVVGKEILRRAFEPLGVPHRGDYVHGEFGDVGDWIRYRPGVQQWINNNAATIDQMCRAILRRTDMDTPSSRSVMAAYVVNDLLRAIDDVCAGTLPHRPLSERLASEGVLPMFGFPTRVRYLYHGRRPIARFGWPPERGVVDREIEIAISQFAPGAQTVKDDELLTSVGVVDYHSVGGEVIAEPDPLGQPTTVGICRRCQALEENPAPSGGCPYCSAPRVRTDYRTVDLSEPPGSLTWWAAEGEYNGVFEFTPRALKARLGRPPGQVIRPPSVNFEIESDTARIYRVNDNDGQDFEFRKIASDNVWIVDDAFQQARRDLPASRRRATGNPQYDNSASSLRRALAAISRTDVLAAGIRSTPVGIMLNPAVAEGRAAWYSFGFLTRRAAAVRLDVADSELDVGIQPLMDLHTPFAAPTARIFVSDSLENGAGYSTYLGQPTEFEDLLRFMLGQLGRPSADFYDVFRVGNDHERDCSSSCHRCLRDYGNMPFHPLLDWRLALDMVRLALDSSAPVDLAVPYWDTLVQRTARPYFQGLRLNRILLGGLEAGHDPVTGEVVILTHPLWDQDEANFRPEVAAAVAEAEVRGWRWRLLSIFMAVRFPYA